MRSAWLLGLLGAGACNAVFGLEPVERGPVDAPIVDATPDAPPDADPCVTDDFDGDALQPHWGVTIGGAPTLSDVSGSRLLIADAPFAATPSMPAVSWIYDLDTDRGNQLAWVQSIGDNDFTLDADLGWSSTNPELTIAGVGVSDESGTIAAYAGMQDGGTTATGKPSAHLRGDPDLIYTGPNAEPGSSQIRIVRTAGIATLTIDDVDVLTGVMPSSIAAVVIVYVRYKLNAVAQPFGSFEVRQIRVCH